MFKTLISFFLFFQPLSAAYIFVDGTFCDARYAPLLTASEHFEAGSTAFEAKQWEEALRHFRTLTLYFENTPYWGDSLFYAGVCYYYLAEYDLANELISEYLSSDNKLLHYEKAFEYKYCIAEQFAAGAKKHLFGKAALPKLQGATKEAKELFDEVIACLPTEELAAKALFAKAKLVRQESGYRESVETLLTIPRRFPKHPLACESYFSISDIYLEEIHREPQNPDLIALAKVNRERFQKSFPGDERLNYLDGNLAKMAQVYGEAIYEMGRYFERKKKGKAAMIYYKEAVSRYPDTEAAHIAGRRLAELRSELAPTAPPNEKALASS